MNRAFLIILAPGFLVALLYLAMGWGWRVSLPAGGLALALAGTFVLLRGRARRGTG